MSNIDWSGQTPTPPQSPPPAESIWSGNAPAASAPEQPQFAPYTSPAPQKSRAWIGITLGSLALVLSILGLIVVMLILRISPEGSTAPAPKTIPPAIIDSEDRLETGSILPSTEYAMSDRPGWQEMVDTVSGINAKYKDALADGTIVGMTPVSVKENPDYFKDFLYILWDYNAAIPFMELSGGTDPVELDAQISSLRDKALLVEQQFMKGEEFGISISITREDGTTYESDGKLSEAPDGSPLVADPEEYARSFDPKTDASGTHIESAALLSAQFGRYMSYDFQTIYDHCTGSGEDTYVMAAFCAYNPSMIYVNTEHGAFPMGYSHPGFLDTVKHELAHAIIYDTCGTSSPIIAGGSVEAVTSSYAVLFLGADFDQLQKSAGSFPEYTMTETSNGVASSIKSGVCR